MDADESHDRIYVLRVENNPQDLILEAGTMFLCSGRPYVVVQRDIGNMRILNLTTADVPFTHDALNKRYVKLLGNA